MDCEKEGCDKTLTAKVEEYSKGKFGKALCFECQKTATPTQGVKPVGVPTLQDIKTAIMAQKALPSTEVDEKIKSKMKELSGLVSEEGAATIIANELSVEVPVPKPFKKSWQGKKDDTDWDAKERRKMRDNAQTRATGFLQLAKELDLIDKDKIKTINDLQDLWGAIAENSFAFTYDKDKVYSEKKTIPDKVFNAEKPLDEEAIGGK